MTVEQALADYRAAKATCDRLQEVEDAAHRALNAAGNELNAAVNVLAIAQRDLLDAAGRIEATETT